jgi:probable HAF family extracellular repeat protein
MKAYKLLVVTMAAALTFGLAACGGGGGGGVAGAPAPDPVPVAPDLNPAFATTAPLAPAAAATFSAGLAINDSAVVVGTSDGGAGSPTIVKATAWATPASAVTVLALPAGVNGPYSAAYGINTGGLIVGEMAVTADGTIVPAAWASSAATAAGLALGATATQGSAYGVNAGGRIVGEVIDGGVTMAVTWASSAAAAPTVLPTPAGTLSSSAYAISVNSEIVGEMTGAAGVTTAVVWRPTAGAVGGYGAPIELPRLATLPGDAIALGINSAGNIVGEAETAAGVVHAVYWQQGAGVAYTQIDLGPVGVDSGAAGINTAERIVGYVRDAAAVPAASAWGGGGVTPVAMNVGLGSSQAYGINTAGQAVGISGGQAFVATP